MKCPMALSLPKPPIRNFLGVLEAEEESLREAELEVD
jgi:hypothetical protein